MITYAGIPLNVPTPDLAAWITSNVRLHWEALGETAWPRAVNRGGTPVPRGDDHFVPGRLSWPRDASRFSTGIFTVSEHRAEEIRAQVYAGNSYRPRDLVLSDGVRPALTANMYWLPPLPLSQAPGGNGWWLTVLVDQRFFWWFKGAAISLTEGTTTWAQVYAALGTALGITILHDDVPAAYLEPAASLTSPLEPLPVVFDRIARSLGQRVVCDLDGTVRALSAESSQTRTEANLLRTRLVAGGELALEK